MPHVLKAEKYFQLIVEAAPNAMLMVNHKGEITLVNKQTEILFGYSREELMGKPVEILIPERFRARHPGHRDNFFSKPVIRLMGVGRDLFGQRQDGSEVPIEIGLNPIETTEGLYILAAIIDITERKRTEENLKMFSADLERRVAERTQELEVSNRVLKEKILEANKVTQALHETQEQLLESQKMEAIGKLAGGIAHDFNNILGGILGYASLLEEKFINDAEVSGKISAIESLAERGANLTQELLGFARQGKYEKITINLNQQVEEIEILLAASLGKNIIIKKTLAADLWSVEGDPNQIMQILMNLGLNARDAMPEGGIITVATENIEVNSDGVVPGAPDKFKMQPGQYVHLAFADSGSGIAQKIRNKIYDPFFTTKPPGKGTGLGLSMVYGIMQNHGGNILLDSLVDKGSLFHLYFPKKIPDYR